MDWGKGYTATYYMTIIDHKTWRDTKRIELIGGSIKRALDGLMESASVDCQSFGIGVEKWVRIYLDTEQDGKSSHNALFTGLATQPENNSDGVIIKGQLDCYSVLKPAEEVYLLPGWYAQAGVSGGEIIKKLLDVTPAPVTVADSAPVLSQNIIAEKKETHLTMIDKILTAMNWRIRIEGTGKISIEPKNEESKVQFSPLDNDCLEKEISVKADWFDCPNVFMATEGDATAIARDDNENSALSTIRRGREVWAADFDVNLSDNESLAQFAQRQLKALQQIVMQGQYTRRFFPDVMPGDYISLNYPAQGLYGKYMIESQSIELTHAAKTSETVTAGVDNE